MARLEGGDLDTVASFVNGALSGEGEDTTKLVTAIKGFISDSKTILTGPAWEKEFAILEQFYPILEKRQALASSIIAASSAANGVMSGYLAKYGRSEADDSRLNDLYKLQAEYHNSLNSLLTMDKEERILHGGEIYKYQNELIPNIEKEIKFLEELVPTDSSAYGNFGNIDTDISTLATSIK